MLNAVTDWEPVRYLKRVWTGCFAGGVPSGPGGTHDFTLQTRRLLIRAEHCQKRTSVSWANAANLMNRSAMRGA